MVPFGNFEGEMAFGFGWVMVILFVLMVAGIVYLAWKGGGGRRARVHEGHRDSNAPPDIMRSGAGRARSKPKNPR